MKAALASDLHLEFDPIELTNSEKAKLLILSGDITIAEDLYRHPTPEEDFAKVQLEYPNILWKPSDNQLRSIMYTKFFKRVSEEFEYVIYILGNHEYYHGKFPDAIQWIKDHVAQFKNIYVLEKETLVIDDLTFVGGTLWTDFNKSNPITMSNAQRVMNDYHKVHNSVYGYRKLIPLDVLKEHVKTLEFFKQTVESDPTKKYVVCGHHAPTLLSIHDFYKAESEFHNNGAYASDLSEFILDHPQIAVWTHGHTHTPFDYVMGQTRVICNPRGYLKYDYHAADFRLKFFDI